MLMDSGALTVVDVLCLCLSLVEIGVVTGRGRTISGGGWIEGFDEDARLKGKC